MKLKRAAGHHTDISNRLRALRNFYEMSSKDFAESAGVPPKSYPQWESGYFRISIDGALKIRERYGTSLDFIYTGCLDTLSNKIATALADSPLIKKSSLST
jgi:transcriptional regulator with XRE-family HTH domain